MHSWGCVWLGEGHAWPGGLHGRGGAWQGACVAGGACGAEGGGHAWQGGQHFREACVAWGVHDTHNPPPRADTAAAAYGQ